MTPTEIKKKVLKYKWEKWLERPFGIFVLSVFGDGITRKSMKKLGVNAEYGVTIFSNSCWYESHEVTDPFANELRKYIKSGKSVLNISSSCEKFRDKSKKKIQEIIKSKKSPQKKIKEIGEILSLATSFIWLAHGLEDIYTEKLQKEVPKYFKGDIDKFIGDISFPKKKNAHTLFEEAIQKGMKPEKIVEKYGWIKSRDGFSDGFSIQEVKEEQKKVSKNKKKEEKFSVKIPKELKKLASEEHELVYFRTLRTDVFYELFFAARPVLKEVATHYRIPFQKLKNYSIFDLAKGKPKEYPESVNVIDYKGTLVISEKPIFTEEKITDETIKGTIAFKGKARGVVKIVNSVNELSKVKVGDILVTPMTFPSFIVAMKKAIAFVTNEGGITCHAAIVAREMKKPCIIGTKIATKVLKDGMTVEVDANTGIVRIVK